jgi:acyl-coenzyme A synthetase/AMP-(fatty) acid ligase
MGNCDVYGDKVAFADAIDGRSVSFNQLKSQVMQVAAALLERGFQKDDVMVTNATNCIE